MQPEHTGRLLKMSFNNSVLLVLFCGQIFAVLIMISDSNKFLQCLWLFNNAQL